MTSPVWLAERVEEGEVWFRIGRTGDRLIAEWPGLCTLTVRPDGSEPELSTVPGAHELTMEKVRRGAAYALVVSILAIQLFHYDLLTGTLLRLKTSYGRVVDAVAGLHLNKAVVLMESAPGFKPKNFNPNAADWEHSPLFFVPDPGPLRRDEFACALRRPHWVLVSYRQSRNAAVIEGRGVAPCANRPN